MSANCLVTALRSDRAAMLAIVLAIGRGPWWNIPGRVEAFVVRRFLLRFIATLDSAIAQLEKDKP